MDKKPYLYMSRVYIVASVLAFVGAVYLIYTESYDKLMFTVAIGFLLTSLACAYIQICNLIEMMNDRDKR